MNRPLCLRSGLEGFRFQGSLPPRQPTQQEEQLPSPVGARGQAPCVCVPPPGRQRTHLQPSGSGAAAEELALSPEATPLSPGPAVQTMTLATQGRVAVAALPHGFLPSGQVKTWGGKKKRETRRKQPRSNINSRSSLSTLPSKAALCVWAVAEVPAVTPGSGGDCRTA